ncbi:serine/threonine-protein kinase [Beggiatoa leptomitoformis]|uniref:Protein kinase n=1 Tax=Beggiatoa leptomitoformis TaxID=288004 RepID=A0A2N9YFB4_9GAMM|nr:serine/threonine-protein kinase [Beggiatoa leptomitoformis]AUI69143.1 protein kinase [Beggiatoa leptomitoformis]QGX03756.1 protein kinase [Beggiatoa leptomitoformis]
MTLPTTMPTVITTTLLDTLCINCMLDKGQAEVCLACGYNALTHKDHPLYLKPKTLLKNQYIVGKPLGQGGFGVTYIGIDCWLQKRVAIKEYLPASLASRASAESTIVPLKNQDQAFQQGLALFIDEARNLAKFDHPHIVRVSNFFEENQTGYMVMDFLDGDNLAVFLDKNGGKITTEQTLNIILPILDALSVVHDKHIYHRDISLHNILLLKTGVPILIDFGAARHIMGEHSRSLDLVLKHGYSPLEQYSGRGKIGAWTDIYACGALLYQLLSGMLPPAATDRFCEESLISLTDIAGLNIPPFLSQTIEKALAVRLENRFQSVADFKAALLGEPFAPLTTPHNDETTASKHQRFIWSSVLFLLIIIITSISYFRPFTAPIDKLLNTAQQQWQTQQLTSPAGNNVYETYQQILRLDPSNQAAQQGLKQLAAIYQQQAILLKNKGDLSNSLKIIQQGLSLLPQQTELVNLEHTLSQLIQEQNQQTQLADLLNKATHELELAQLVEAYQTYQQILQLDSSNPQAQAGLSQLADEYVNLAKRQTTLTDELTIVQQGLTYFPTHQNLLTLQKTLARESRIQTLLAQAEQQINALQLTEPIDDNAYNSYQQILILDPEQAQAKAGLLRIAEQYERMARAERQPEKRAHLIEKGLKVLPTHPNLLALAQQYLLPTNKPTPPPVPTTEPPATTPLPSNSSTDNPLQTLLKTATQQIKAGQLETAIYIYHNVLLLDEKNTQALTGLTQIANRYAQLAQERVEKAALQEGLALVEKGLTAQANNATLLTLQTDIRRRLAEQQTQKEEKKQEDEKEKPSRPLIFTPSF